MCDNGATRAMIPEPTMDSRQLMARVRLALGRSQRSLGELVGVSRRTVIRWEQRGAILGPRVWEILARECYPRDRNLAAQCAAYARQTLQSLGLERPAPPPPPAPPPRPPPSPAHMGDSVVCAAAEAMQLTPQAMRPGVVAALERIVALAMTAEEALAAMSPAKTEKTAKGGKASA